MAMTTDELREMLDDGLKQSYYDQLPTEMLPNVYRYVIDGLQPGHFLTAVITNNLLDAVNRADSRNLKALGTWIKFFYNVCPSGCYGNIETMKNWMDERRSYNVSTNKNSGF